MRRLSLLLLLPGLLAAADLTGLWVGEITDVAFKLTQNGQTIGGKLYGDYKSSLIREGTIIGDQVSFVVIVEEQSGNQINQTRYKYTGVFKDGILELTRERESSTIAGNGGGVQSRNTAKPTFRLNRLY